MDVANDGHRGAHGLHVALFDQDLARHIAELLHVRFGQGFAVHQVLHPLVALCDHVTKSPTGRGRRRRVRRVRRHVAYSRGLLLRRGRTVVFNVLDNAGHGSLSAGCSSIFFAGTLPSVPVPVSSQKPLCVEPGSSVFRRWSAKKKQLQSHACCSSVPLVREGVVISARGEKALTYWHF